MSKASSRVLFKSDAHWRRENRIVQPFICQKTRRNIWELKIPDQNLVPGAEELWKPLEWLIDETVGKMKNLVLTVVKRTQTFVSKLCWNFNSKRLAYYGFDSSEDLDQWKNTEEQGNTFIYNHNCEQLDNSLTVALIKLNELQRGTLCYSILNHLLNFRNWKTSFVVILVWFTLLDDKVFLFKKSDGMSLSFGEHCGDHLMETTHVIVVKNGCLSSTHFFLSQSIYSSDWIPFIYHI
jgi:hypothetical protein